MDGSTEMLVIAPYAVAGSAALQGMRVRMVGSIDATGPMPTLLLPADSAVEDAVLHCTHYSHARLLHGTWKGFDRRGMNTANTGNEDRVSHVAGVDVFCCCTSHGVPIAPFSHTSPYIMGLMPFWCIWDRNCATVCRL